MLEKGAATAAAVLETIREDPSRHDQERWVSFCGTQACAAGWAAMMHGWEAAQVRSLADQMYSAAQWKALFVLHYPCPGSDGAGTYVAPVSRLVEVAADLLDLEPVDAVTLFYYTNNAEALEALEWVAAGKDLSWDEIGASRLPGRPRVYDPVVDANLGLSDWL